MQTNCVMLTLKLKKKTQKRVRKEFLTSYYCNKFHQVRQSNNIVRRQSEKVDLPQGCDAMVFKSAYQVIISLDS